LTNFTKVAQLAMLSGGRPRFMRRELAARCSDRDRRRQLRVPGNRRLRRTVACVFGPTFTLNALKPLKMRFDLSEQGQKFVRKAVSNLHTSRIFLSY
jgi:hypothetical protein